MSRDGWNEGVFLAGAPDHVDVVRPGGEHIDEFADLLAGRWLTTVRPLQVIDVVLVVGEVGPAWLPRRSRSTRRVELSVQPREISIAGELHDRVALRADDLEDACGLAGDVQLRAGGEALWVRCERRDFDVAAEPPGLVDAAHGNASPAGGTGRVHGFLGAVGHVDRGGDCGGRPALVDVERGADAGADGRDVKQ